MAWIEFLTRPGVQKLAETLLHFLWQGTLVVLLLELALRWSRIARPETRCRVYLAGLLTLASCPVLTWLALPHTGELPASALSVDLATLELSAADESAELLPLEPAPRRWTWQAVAVGVWLLGVGLLSGRLLLGMLGIRWLQRSGRAVGPQWQEQVARLGERLGLRRLPRVLWSARVNEAMALGFFRPVILLPLAWLTLLPPDLLEAALAHELAHLRRRDLWVNALQRVLETVLFYHPAVWWISAQVRTERELCCDQLAVSATGRREAYARTLEFLAWSHFQAKRPALAAGLGGAKMSLLQRVRCILGSSTARTTSWSLASLFLLAVPVVLWFTAFSSLNSAQAGEEPASLFGQSLLAFFVDDEDPKPNDEDDKPRPKEEGRPEEERPRDGERRPEEGRPRDGERRPEEGRPRDGERRPTEERPRDGERRPEEGRPRDGERRPERNLEGNRELVELIMQLRREVEMLRREVRDLREGRPPREGERRPEGERPRDGERRPEGERPRDGEKRPEGERPRDGEQKPEREKEVRQ